MWNEAHFACKDDNDDDDDDADGDHDGRQHDNQLVVLGRRGRLSVDWASFAVAEQTRTVVAAIVVQIDVVRPVLQRKSPCIVRAEFGSEKRNLLPRSSGGSRI